ncbi:hypothetical protein FK178_06060 [Antarcticibacterium arcticum]|uniref:Glycerophosphoryl diester phosphodiesterase membrane domain-containing protein n=1 Tax=Antarcticibacterium arcticum TaxID=2585771 RepID=A0A5B8YHL8_9FLAO|nr:hypothetical protein [Antarcticibacterium arcticum]QED37304.1 hypothetical protein FK178_06060 [Antarcticibacterium arcticum]
MENNWFIEFKKQRELGDIINITFKFIRENYKPLFQLIYKIVGPFFILLILAVAYYTYSVAGNPIEALTSGGSNFVISILLMLAAMLLFYAALYGTILHYIKNYISNYGQMNETDVKNGVQKDFFNLILLSVISAILIIAGMMLLILPGIYLMVPLALAGSILVFKNYSVSEAISYSFTLIKDNWWITFVSLLVIWILVYFIGLVFQVPLIIYTVVKTLTMAQEGSMADPASYSDWIFITLNVLSTVIQYLLSTISIIGLAFIYFNLNEHKNLTGTYETIDKLGE